MSVLGVSYRSYRVWQRNRDVVFRLWFVELVPSVFGPLIVLTAVGLGLGVLLSWALDDRTLGGQSFQTSFSGDFAVLALVVGAGIGLFFGIYPAMRAAKLHPIDALRYE